MKRSRSSYPLHCLFACDGKRFALVSYVWMSTSWFSPFLRREGRSFDFARQLLFVKNFIWKGVIEKSSRIDNERTKTTKVRRMYTLCAINLTQSFYILRAVKNYTGYSVDEKANKNEEFNWYFQKVNK